MRFLGDDDTLVYRNACLCDIVTFSLESDRVENHAVTDDILRILSEDSRRNRSEYETLAFEME